MPPSLRPHSRRARTGQRLWGAGKGGAEPGWSRSLLCEMGPWKGVGQGSTPQGSTPQGCAGSCARFSARLGFGPGPLAVGASRRICPGMGAREEQEGPGARHGTARHGCGCGVPGTWRGCGRCHLRGAMVCGWLCHQRVPGGCVTWSPKCPLSVSPGSQSAPSLCHLHPNVPHLSPASQSVPRCPCHLDLSDIPGYWCHLHPIVSPGASPQFTPTRGSPQQHRASPSHSSGQGWVPWNPKSRWAPPGALLLPAPPAGAAPSPATLSHVPTLAVPRLGHRDGREGTQPLRASQGSLPAGTEDLGSAGGSARPRPHLQSRGRVWPSGSVCHGNVHIS